MYGPSTRTVGDVSRAVKRQFGDESGAQLEDADILMWVNEALVEIAKRNRIDKTTATSDSVIGQNEYQYPAEDILQIESIHYNGTVLHNIPFAQAEQDFINSPAGYGNGTPAYWCEWGGIFYLFPAPSAILPIKIWYTRNSPYVTSTTDLLPVGDKYFSTVIQYVLQQAYEMDDDLEASQLKSNQFRESVDFLAEEERTAQNMTYGTITVIDF